MNRRILSLAGRLTAAALAGLTVLPESRGEPAATSKETKPMIKVTSPAFSAGQPIPTKYTCDGADVSPPLKWDGVPDGTKSLALICDDPDAPAGTWVHWVVYDLPRTATELTEKTAATDTLPNGAKQGLNDFKRTGYGGPCPPPGETHRYFFKLYALSIATSLKPRASKADVLRAMQGHVLAEGELTGTYQRAK